MRSVEYHSIENQAKQKGFCEQADLRPAHSLNCEESLEPVTRLLAE